MTEDTFTTRLAEALDMIDRTLSDEGVPVRQRPFQAAIEFVRFFIIEIQIGDELPKAPGEFTEIILSDWFKPVMQNVTAW